jgi:hypothetical protein
MTLNSAAPPDWILTRSPPVRACRGHDLAPRVNQTQFAALAPFAKIAELLAELLHVGGAVNAGTVRNRTRRVGERIARLRPARGADPEIDAVTPAAVIGLDGGYLRSRHRRPERNFEVIAGKVLNLDGIAISLCLCA